MEQALAQLAMSLKKTIDEVTASMALTDGDADSRALHRALALLWSAHDEIVALQPPVRAAS